MINPVKNLTIPAINYLGRKKCQREFSRTPVIIGACPRSGTTLLISILSAHPALFTIKKESWAFVKWNKSQSNGSLQATYHPARIDRFYRYIYFHRIPDETTRWCEKTPRNVVYFKRILDYFHGNIKLIHIVRDGRDVLTSRHPKSPSEYWVDPQRWVYDVGIGLKFRDLPQVYTLKYEDLIQNYSSTIRKIFEFIGEPYHPNLDNWFQHTELSRPESLFKPVQKIHRNSIGKWKQEKYRSRVREIMEIDDVVELLGRLNYI